jgi:hypothetical protein
MTLPPLQIVVDAAKYAVLPAFFGSAVVAGLVLAILGRRAALVAGAAAVVAGWAAGNAARGVVPWLPDGRRIEWLAPLALLALVAILAIRWSRVPPAVGYALWAAVMAVAAVKCLPADWLAKTWPVSALIFALAAAMLPRSADRPGWGYAHALVIVAFSAGSVNLVAHSARLLDMGTITATAAAGAAVVLGIVRADVSGMMPFIAVITTGICAAGYHETYSDVPAISFVGPVLGLVLIGVTATSSRRSVTAAGYTLAIILGLAAVAVAHWFDPVDFAYLHS